MRLYYTTEFKYLDKQLQPSLSLGGFMSSTVIENGMIGNLFSEVTVSNVDKTEIIGVILKNEIEDYDNLDILIEYPTDPICKIEIAVVTPTNNAIERLNSRQSTPYTGTFYEPKDEDSKMELGEFKKDDLLGVWIRRTILQSYKDQINDNTYLENNFGITPSINESFKIKFITT